MDSTPEERADALAAMAAYVEEETRDAAQKWHVTFDHGFFHLIRTVEAAAGTGSRYVVVATKLVKAAATQLNGTHVISVLYPTSRTFVASQGDIHMSYVHEKVYDNRSVHGGDLAAMTATIQWALNGELGPEVLAYRKK